MLTAAGFPFLHFAVFCAIMPLALFPFVLLTSNFLIFGITQAFLPQLNCHPNRKNGLPSVPSYVS